jgi:hypothetical protein
MLALSRSSGDSPAHRQRGRFADCVNFYYYYYYFFFLQIVLIEMCFFVHDYDDYVKYYQICGFYGIN